MATMQSAAVAVCLLAGAAGCGFGSTTDGTLGDLGQGVFQYTCVDDGDAVCNETDAVDSHATGPDLGLAGELPAAVAIGARFDLHYYGNAPDEGLPFLEIVAARTDAVHAKGGFIIREPGLHAFLARSADGVVADFVHLRAVEVDHLDVWLNEQRIHAVSLSPGAARYLAVVPSDADGVSLAGAVGYTWTSSDPTVVTLGAATAGADAAAGVEINDDEVRLVAAGDGEATITVERGGVSRIIDVLVSSEVTP